MNMFVCFLVALFGVLVSVDASAATTATLAFAVDERDGSFLTGPQWFPAEIYPLAETVCRGVKFRPKEQVPFLSSGNAKRDVFVLIDYKFAKCDARHVAVPHGHWGCIGAARMFATVGGESWEYTYWFTATGATAPSANSSLDTSVQAFIKQQAIATRTHGSAEHYVPAHPSTKVVLRRWMSVPQCATYW